MFAYGVAECRAKGRHQVKVYYDTELLMTCLEVGDEALTLKVYLPTHKLSKLLADAFEAQARDPRAVGHNSWLEDRVGGQLSQV